jgi:hypothetical protein
MEVKSPRRSHRRQVGAIDLNRPGGSGEPPPTCLHHFSRSMRVAEVSDRNRIPNLPDELMKG